VVITAADLERTLAFYERVLGGRRDPRPYVVDGEIAVRRLVFGAFAMSVHRRGSKATPVADRAGVGALDVCLRWEAPIETAVEHLASCGVEIIEGPAPRRSSAEEPARSVYFRDPDGNLIELMALDG